MFGTMPIAAKEVERGLTVEHSRAIALRALGFVSGDQGYLDRFLASTTIARTDLTRRPVSTALLAGLLDFVIDNELVLLRFARAIDLPVESIYEARRLLNGFPQNREDRAPWRGLPRNLVPVRAGAGRAT